MYTYNLYPFQPSLWPHLMPWCFIRLPVFYVFYYLKVLQISFPIVGGLHSILPLLKYLYHTISLSGMIMPAPPYAAVLVTGLSFIGHYDSPTRE